MNTQRNPKVIEIVVIILFIIMTTFLIFIGETFFVFLKDNDSISKVELKRILTKSFLQALFIDIGLVVMYFINKKRIRDGKKVI
ncbi:MAG: hypothetical protein ABI850_06015 [Flavobacterium sp.]